MSITEPIHTLNFFSKLYKVNCVISTPQFLGSQDKYTMFKQKGTFHFFSMKFIHSEPNGHDVQFHSLKSFRSSIIQFLD